ncbi:hypothetical protein HMSSN139_67260 [Paenibacillus sp. HMSSN-139]|nr:hypothetical protein HMSSN139_67260 [Paenibacillus sp. HMSSN-139]
MTDKEIEKEIVNAKREDGTYPYEWVIKMNKAGVWFQFSNVGIRWRRRPFC